MSWIFSICGARPSLPDCHGTPDLTISTDNLYLAVGGNPDTYICESSPDGARGWVVVGIGIDTSEHGSTILGRDGWRTLLADRSFDPAPLDGHFAVLRWDPGGVECFTDQLGLRILYVASYGPGVCISTRLDWIAQTTGLSQIDASALGSRWLLFNQLSYGSCVGGISRLGPSGHAVLRHGTTTRLTLYKPWHPRHGPETHRHAMKILDGLIEAALRYSRPPSLGLSGGMDSRLLLALLAQHARAPFSTHTFGVANDPDVQIAGRMGAELGTHHRVFDEPLPDVSSCIGAISSYAAQAVLTEPASSHLKLRYYGKLREAGLLLIDGGFGEIARRQYLNRIVRLGRRALRSRDAPQLLKLLRVDRANFFSKEFSQLLEEGARRGLEQTLDEMPDLDGTGVENYVDLLAIRTRVPNYGGPEQSRIDAEVMNFMPLVQPSFLRAALSLPATARANAGVYYNVIRHQCPALTRFPMVKSGTTFPFGLSSTTSWLVVRIKSNVGTPYVDQAPEQLFTLLREYIVDLSHSHEVTSNPQYDHRKLSRAVTGYYSGDRRWRRSVDWWLTFELWKRSLSRHR